MLRRLRYENNKLLIDNDFTELVERPTLNSMESRKYLLWTFVFFSFFANKAQATFWKKCNLSEPDKLNKKSFDRCTQKQLDDFYQTLFAGPMPDGVFDGKVQLSSTKKLENFEIISELLDFIPGFKREVAEFVMERFWKGKMFYRTDSDNADLYNRILESSIPATYRDDLGEADFEHGWLKKRGYELFPAHVYFGESLFDSSKQSIIIDYAHNQDIEGYRPKIDWLVNEDGLEIRDEIRRVNYNLYLGRAYAKGQFLLNFVLENTTPVTPR